MFTERNESNIGLAKALANAIGFNLKMVRHYDNDKKNSIDILSLDDPLDESNNIHCTIGLSDIPTLILEEKQDFGIEIFLVGKKDFDFISELLSTCSFFIGKDNWEARPGEVFNNLVTLYSKNLALKHIYFIEPFLWADKLESISKSIDEKKVIFLLAIPITDNELKYKEEFGDDASEELLFSKKEIDIFDLDRASVL